MIPDLGLPDLDGVAVLEALRGWSTAPVVVLSARHEEQAKVRPGRRSDYGVTKPFGMGESSCEVARPAGRSTPHVTDTVVTTAAFTVDLGAHRVTAYGADIRPHANRVAPTGDADP